MISMGPGTTQPDRAASSTRSRSGATGCSSDEREATNGKRFRAAARAFAGRWRPGRQVHWVYSSREQAQAAVTRLSRQPGFADAQDGFHIDEYRIDQDHWAEG